MEQGKVLEPDACIFLCKGGTPVQRRIKTPVPGRVVIPERLRLLKEQRCYLLEKIHQQQQKLDQLDYRIFKFYKNIKIKEVPEMDRREFIKVSGAGMLTLFLSGCGVSMIGGGDKKAAGAAAADGVSKSQGGKGMKIVVVTGSPHKAGTSALLADKFIEGAQAAGHEVFRFNAAFEDIHPCLGCDACGMNGPCVQKDAIENKLIQKLVDCDMIAVVTPLYYYGMSAQLKTIVDRFYSRTGRISGKKSLLMATAYNSADWTMSALVDHYNTLVRYMGWKDQGMVLATGCGSRSLIESSKFPDQAYQLGKNL